MKDSQKAYLNVFFWLSVAIACYEVFYLLSSPKASSLSVILILLAGMLAYVFYYLKNN